MVWSEPRFPMTWPVLTVSGVLCVRRVSATKGPSKIIPTPLFGPLPLHCQLLARVASASRKKHIYKLLNDSQGALRWCLGAPQNSSHDTVSPSARSRTSPPTVTFKVRTGASKSLYQAYPCTVAVSKKQFQHSRSGRTTTS